MLVRLNDFDRICLLVMNELDDHGPLTVGEIDSHAFAHLADRAKLVDQLERMKRRGFIEPEWQRMSGSTEYLLTDKGKERLIELRGGQAEYYHHLNGLLVRDMEEK